MKDSAKTHLELIDTQIELLENVNRRLEGMADWQKLYPARSEMIRNTLNEGFNLGADLRSFGNSAECTSSAMLELLARYARFLLVYESTWIACIQNGVKIPAKPAEDSDFRVFPSGGGWMIKRPHAGWFSDFQPTKQAAVAIAEQLCKATGQGTVVVENENGTEMSFTVSAKDV